MSRASSACAAQLRLGKQARDDGARDSDNVLGDVMEALIGALYLEAGLRRRRATSSARAWGDRVQRRRARAAASQIRAAGMGRREQAHGRPTMTSLDRSGPHTPRASPSASSIGERRQKASARATSKQEAETAAAAALLAQVDS